LVCHMLSNTFNWSIALPKGVNEMKHIVKRRHNVIDISPKETNRKNVTNNEKNSLWFKWKGLSQEHFDVLGNIQ
jgi:hypothetical protein